MKSAAPGNQLLALLDPQERAALAAHLSVTAGPQGQVLFEPGDVISHVHFVTRGMISVVTVMSSGATVESMTVGNEGVIGLGAVFGAPTAFARALWQIEGAGLRIEAARLRDAAERSPRLRRLLEIYTQQQLAEAQQSAACNAVHKLEPRMAKWLLRSQDRLPGDFIPLTQEFLGDMLGAQRTTVTQVAGQLQAAGLIRYQRGRVEVIDRAGLERVACECYDAIRRRSEELIAAAR
jgi:CRP-like cAMP-binding protein